VPIIQKIGGAILPWKRRFIAGAFAPVRPIGLAAVEEELKKLA
jgi:hypothetical protein